jgi:hypothetical protein
MTILEMFFITYGYPVIIIRILYFIYLKIKSFKGFMSGYYNIINDLNNINYRDNISRSGIYYLWFMPVTNIVWIFILIAGLIHSYYLHNRINTTVFSPFIILFRKIFLLK